MSLGRHLLSIADLSREEILEIVRVGRSMAEIGERAMPKVPALRGKSVATLFFESSTRTRLSFETAAKRLSADTMSFTPATSSLNKGESLRDTVETIAEMGVDAMIVRHGSSGVPQMITGWTEASVINAGDGQHEHPSQALTDCYTLLEALGERSGGEVSDLSGRSVLIVGDSRHSRVARSNVLAFAALGARVTLVAPRTLLPPSLVGWPVEVSPDLDEALAEADVCYVLRLQSERMGAHEMPSLEEYHDRYAMTDARQRRLKPDALVMHPGPMLRGLEIDDGVASSAATLVRRQVRNGVAVRMAILFLLLSRNTNELDHGEDDVA
jgi:aspartate carbamoyltransferase catalytic subunit